MLATKPTHHFIVVYETYCLLSGDFSQINYKILGWVSFMETMVSLELHNHATKQVQVALLNPRVSI